MQRTLLALVAVALTLGGLHALDPLEAEADAAPTGQTQTVTQ